MKLRREHGECDTVLGGRGCLVFGLPICTFRKRPSKLKTLIRWAWDGNALLWWIFAGLVGLAIGLGLGSISIPDFTLSQSQIFLH